MLKKITIVGFVCLSVASSLFAFISGGRYKGDIEYHHTKTVFVKSTDKTPIDSLLLKLISGDEIISSKLSDENGKTELYADFDKYTEINVIAVDIDGAENGGEFISDTLKLSKDKDFYEIIMNRN